MYCPGGHSTVTWMKKLVFSILFTYTVREPISFGILTPYRQFQYVYFDNLYYKDLSIHV